MRLFTKSTSSCNAAALATASLRASAMVMVSPLGRSMRANACRKLSIPPWSNACTRAASRAHAGVPGRLSAPKRLLAETRDCEDSAVPGRADARLDPLRTGGR